MAIGFADLNSVQRTPDKTLTRNNKPRVIKVQFGDGYEQRIQEGINNITQQFTVTFSNRPKADIDDIMAFFDNKAGTTAFNFTYPDTNASGSEKTVKVVVKTIHSLIPMMIFILVMQPLEEYTKHDTNK